MTSTGACAHTDTVTDVKHPKRRECAECMKMGASWVHLRTCQKCEATRRRRPWRFR